jgi:hypothetical protein
MKRNLISADKVQGLDAGVAKSVIVDANPSGPKGVYHLLYGYDTNYTQKETEFRRTERRYHPNDRCWLEARQGGTVYGRQRQYDSQI